MAFYVVLAGNSSREDVVVMKATSGPTTDGSWSSVAFAGSRLIDSLWAHQEGTDIHIAIVEDEGRILYSKFSTSTDTWTIDREVVIGEQSNLSPQRSVSISVRSDGDVIILYTKSDGSNDRVSYARREGSTWTRDVQVDNAGSEDWYGGVVVRGSSDRMHFFFKNNTNQDAFQRSLTSANALETFPSAGDTDVNTSTDHIFCPGMSYDDGGTQRIRCPYKDQLGGRMSYAEFDSADAPGAFTVNLDVIDNGVKVVSETSVSCSASDGTDEYTIYSRSVNDDLFLDKNDTPDTEVLGSVTGNRISCNVYDNSGTKLAYVWLDATTVKYGEEDISTSENYHVKRPRQVVQEVF